MTFHLNKFTKIFLSFFVGFLIFNINAKSTNAQVFSNESPYIEINETIVFSNVMNEDIYIAGDEIVVNEEINGDFFAAGKKITINAPINGSIRIVAEQITINAPINGSVLFLAETFYVTTNGIIQSDAYGFANTFTLDGEIGRNLKLQATQESQSKISGKVIGNVFYSGSMPQTLDGSTIAGQIFKIEQETISDKEQKLNIIISSLLHSVTMVLVGILFLKLRKRSSITFLADYQSHAFKYFFIGTISIIIIPIVILLLITTIVGIPLALFLIFAMISALYFGFLIPALALGQKIFKSDNLGFLQLISGVLLLDMLIIAPIAGPLISTFVVLSTLGLLTNSLFKYLRK